MRSPVPGESFIGIMWAAPATTTALPRGASEAMASDIAGVEFGSSSPVMNSAGHARAASPCADGPSSDANTVYAAR